MKKRWRRAPGTGLRPRSGGRGATGLWEILEPRQLLSVVPTATPRHVARALPTFEFASSPVQAAATPLLSSPTGTTPAVMRQFYGLNALNFNGVTGDGSGQTIALVEAFDTPTALSDLQTFDARFGLPAPPSFQKLNQAGGTALPSPQAPGGNDWAIETSLDIQWAHVIAPAANIVVIECNSNTDNNLYAGAITAARLPGVVAVSMSFGSGESSFDPGTNHDFVTPAGHPGVTFLGSTGDDGSPGFYPAFSPNVVAVGGTSIHPGAGGTYGSEQAWGGTGGGTSNGIEPEPSYQQSVQSTGWRTTPDVAMDADPGTGVPVFDSYDFPSASGASWIQLGGTSLSAPLWAGIISLADQARSTAGLSSLDGATQTLPRLYSLPASDFHDVTSGSNGTFSAGPGYDEVTGLGTPVGNLLVPDLAGISAPGPTNDNFAGAVQFTSAVASAVGSNVGATREFGEPANTFDSAGQSVWYSWVAPPHAGQVTVSTAGSAFDTTLGIYTGSSVSGLTQVAADGDDQPQGGVNTSLVTFRATPGTTYMISVDGGTASGGQTSGAIRLSVLAAPDNDDFFAAAALSGTAAGDTGFNFNATAEAGEPDTAGVAGTQSVWWSWTAPSGVASATLSTHGSDFANTLGVYTGSSPDTLTPVAETQSDGSDTSTLTFTVSSGTTYYVMVNGVSNRSTGVTARGDVSLNLLTTAPQVASVVGAYLFYNDSVFDANAPAANAADDAAVAPDKQPLLPGNSASFANYSSYSKGINGIMVDLSGLPSGATLTADDFSFLVGNSSDPGTWTAAPAPTAVVDRPGAGALGSDRLEITWANNAIQNTWLQVVVKSDVNTALSAPDVFYFGNAIGESGNSTTDAIVDSSDELGARSDPHSFTNPALITDVCDYNRDGRVDATDQIIARNNQTTAATALVLWTPPQPPAATSAGKLVARPCIPQQPSDSWESLKRRLVVRLRRTPLA